MLFGFYFGLSGRRKKTGSFFPGIHKQGKTLIYLYGVDWTLGVLVKSKNGRPGQNAPVLVVGDSMRIQWYE